MQALKLIKDCWSKALIRRPCKSVAAAIALLGGTEVCYRNTGAYGLVDDLGSFPSRSIDLNAWTEMVSAFDAIVVSRQADTSKLSEEQRWLASENALKRVIINLRFLEKRSGGFDDAYCSLEILPFIGNKLGSFGPLQLRPNSAAEIYLKKYKMLSALSIFSSDSKPAPSKETIKLLLDRNDSKGIAEALNLKQFGGIFLAVLYYEDLYEKCRLNTDNLLKESHFIEKCTLRDMSLGEKRTSPRSIQLLNNQMLDGEGLISAAYPAQMAMICFNSGRASTSNASIQAILNEMSVLLGDKPSIVCDGAISSNSLEKFSNIKSRLNIPESIMAITSLESTINGSTASKHQMLREIWFNCGPNGKASFENEFQYYLRSIYKDASSTDYLKQKNAYQSFSRMFLGNGDLNLARGSVLMAMRDAYRFWLKDKSRTASTKQLQQEWLKLLDKRDPSFVDSIKPENFIRRFANGDISQYGKFMKLLVERVLTYQLLGLYADYPTIYRENYFCGDINPFARVYLGRQLESGVSQSSLSIED